MANKPVNLSDKYPSNSIKSSSINAPAKSKPEKVIKGKVQVKKKSLGKKIGESFIVDDAKLVGEYVLYDIIIPFAKDLVINTIIGSVEMALFGESRRRDRYNGYNNYAKPYGSNYGSMFYNSMYSSNYQPSQPTPKEQKPKASSLNDIIFESRQDAEIVRDNLLKLSNQYDIVSVGDLYDLVGMVGTFTDENVGWCDLKPEEVGVRMVRGGDYILDLPRPTRIK